MCGMDKRIKFCSRPLLGTMRAETWGGHYLHAAVVYDHCLKLDFGVQFSNFLTALQEQSIPKFPVREDKGNKVSQECNGPPSWETIPCKAMSLT